MICGRCDQPIRKGERRRTYLPESASAATPAVTVHWRYCRTTARQTAPTPR